MSYSSHHGSKLLSERNNLPRKVAGTLSLAPAERLDLRHLFAFTKIIFTWRIFSLTTLLLLLLGDADEGQTLSDMNPIITLSHLIAVTSGNINTVTVSCGLIHSIGTSLQSDFSEAKGEDVLASLKKYFQSSLLITPLKGIAICRSQKSL